MNIRNISFGSAYNVIPTAGTQKPSCSPDNKNYNNKYANLGVNNQQANNYNQNYKPL